MKAVPICQIIRGLRSMSRPMQQEKIAALIKAEKGRTKRKSELEALAFSICFRMVEKAALNARRERRVRH